MPINTYLQYERAIEKIVGIETLRAFEIQLFPHIKPSGQKDLRRKYQKMAGLSTGDAQRFEDAVKEIQSWQMKK